MSKAERVAWIATLDSFDGCGGVWLATDEEDLRNVVYGAAKDAGYERVDDLEMRHVRAWALDEWMNNPVRIGDSGHSIESILVALMRELMDAKAEIVRLRLLKEPK